MSRQLLDLPPPPWIVGHRGAAGEAPENTPESVRRAVDQSVDMVEVDLQLSGDGRLVAFHDWNLERVAGIPWVVEEEPLEKLRAVELTAAEEGGGVTRRIATLEEILRALPPDLPLNCELKCRLADPRRFIEALGEGLASRDQVLFSSFDWHLLAELLRRLPERPVAPLAKRDGPSLLAAATELEAFSIHCHRRLACRRLIRAARDVGRPVLAYTVNRPRAARRLLRRGISGIFTDFPGRLRHALEEKR